MKKLKIIVLPVVAALVIEIGYFNFRPLVNAIQRIDSITYTSDDLEFVNWSESEDGRVSSPDPMIIRENISTMVDSFRIHIDAVPQPTSYTVFYTEGPNEVFNAEKMIVLTDMTGDDTIKLRRRVTAIRVDPGDEAGVLLKDVSFYLNEVPWDISVSRLIAIPAIIWGIALLMKLQASPIYDVTSQEEKHEDET